MLTDNGLQDGLVVMLAGTQIQAIVPADDARVTQADTRLDLGGASLLPGFIDIQVNGGGGVLFNNARDPRHWPRSPPRIVASAPPACCQP